MTADVSTRRLVARDMTRRILELGAQLPAGQRRVVTLRDVEGLSSRQCARMNGPDEQTGGHEITCGQAVALVTDYLDDALTAQDRARFETRLSECPLCTEHFRQIRISIAGLGRVRASDLSPRTRQDLILLYRRWRAGDED